VNHTSAIIHSPRPANDAPHIAVVGASDADPETQALAEEVGRRVAESGAVVVCGGLGGVMEAACRGAGGAGGMTVGLLPGDDRSAANRYVQVAIATGLGELRNGLLVRCADALIAVGGGYGTLSEIGLALRTEVPVVGLGTWQLGRAGRPDTGIVEANDAQDAVRRALELVTARAAAPDPRPRP
jgi:hypothetical protein